MAIDDGTLDPVLTDNCLMPGLPDTLHRPNILRLAKLLDRSASVAAAIADNTLEHNQPIDTISAFRLLKFLATIEDHIRAAHLSPPPLDDPEINLEPEPA